MCAYTCVKRRSRFWIAFAVGKWNKETCTALVEKIKQCIKVPRSSRRLKIFSDGNDDYTFVLSEKVGKERVNYGQLIKRYEEGKLVKEKRIVFGSFNKEKIETTVVENLNSVIRERLGRFVRKTKCFAKTKERLKAALSIFRFYWNFMKVLNQKKVTPAMAECIENHVWDWSELLNHKLRVVK